MSWLIVGFVYKLDNCKCKCKCAQGIIRFVSLSVTGNKII